MSKLKSTSQIQVNCGQSVMLALLLFSIINIFTIFFSGRYYVFSLYVPQALMTVGLMMNDLPIALIMALISFAYLIPYVICTIFYKKRFPWMIVALALLSVDTVVFLVDFIHYVSVGDLSLISNLVLRVLALVALSLGIVGHFGVEKEKLAQAFTPINALDSTEDKETRLITVSRQNTFVASAFPMIVYVNETEICRLKRGEIKTIQAPVHAFELNLMFTNGEGGLTIQIPEGDENLQYDAFAEIKFSRVKITAMPVKA